VSTSNVAFKTGVATGGAASGDFRFQTGTRVVATGSAAQALGDRLTICAKDIACSTTSATPTQFASLTTTNVAGTFPGSVVGGRFVVTVEATDGTDTSGCTAVVVFNVSNKAGTLTIGTPNIVEVTSATAGAALSITTLGVTVVASGSTILLKVTPVWTGTSLLTVSAVKASWEASTQGLTSVSTS
jgi:hypothetical protein